MSNFSKNRRAMVDCQMRTFDITDLSVIDAFDAVPREAFVGSDQQTLAYSDANLPVPGSSRTMLKPMVLGRLIQSLELSVGENVLLIAGGTGYAAMILANMGVKVTLLDSDAALTERAEITLGQLGVAGVSCLTAPMELGVASAAPFDAILIEGVVEQVPEQLLAQLTSSGRLVCLEGEGIATKAMMYKKSGATIGSRWLFDATGTRLAAFAKAKAFVF